MIFCQYCNKPVANFDTTFCGDFCKCRNGIKIGLSEIHSGNSQEADQIIDYFENQKSQLESDLSESLYLNTCQAKKLSELSSKLDIVTGLVKTFYEDVCEHTDLDHGDIEAYLEEILDELSGLTPVK